MDSTNYRYNRKRSRSRSSDSSSETRIVYCVSEIFKDDYRNKRQSNRKTHSSAEYDKRSLSPVATSSRYDEHKSRNRRSFSRSPVHSSDNFRRRYKRQRSRTPDRECHRCRSKPEMPYDEGNGYPRPPILPPYLPSPFSMVPPPFSMMPPCTSDGPSLPHRPSIRLPAWLNYANYEHFKSDMEKMKKAEEEENENVQQNENVEQSAECS